MADRLIDERKKPPEFTAEVAGPSIFDLERCVIEYVNIGKPWVYRQPDRPGEVMLVWDSREFGNTTILELKGTEKVAARFWGKNKMWEVFQQCAADLGAHSSH
ncbi:hypothetical protein [Altererythrobacter sp. TH136]|uniref:hypothetical protein n=1 Tax=Altererythrobacter sp. TH136 TaxID=2067415 RepID=UPI0011648642|nr:hypothetical protein [Altererythrobacter sp. TH136]QDM40637.1 hypothetical protein C0V74_05955 [Altererythrobacter sp. TH136]